MRRHRLLGLALTGFLFVLSGCQPTPEERLSRAEDYIAAADYRTAVIELQNLLQAAPDNGKARLLLAETSYQLGDFPGAVSQFERAIGLGETDTSTWIAFGRALLSQGRAVEALERVVSNLDEGATDPEIHVLLGDVQFALNNMDSAAVHYSRAVEFDPENVRGVVGQAMVHAGKGDDSAARALLDKAVAIDPGSSTVWLAQGNFHRVKREFADAATAYGEAVRLVNDRTPLAEAFVSRVSHVSVLVDSGQLGEAGTRLEELTASFPDHPVAGFLKGRLAFAEGDYETAQLQLQDYLSNNPHDARVNAVLGAINFSQDNLRQAEANLLAAVRANAGGMATRRLLAETRLRLDNPGGALEVLQPLTALDEPDALYLSMLGRAQVAAGDDEAAIEYFRQGIEADPANDAIKLALASTYLKVRREELAIELLDSMPIEAGSQLRRQTLLIAALARHGDTDRAIAESDRLLRASPDDPAAHVVAGALYQSLGQPGRAKSALLEALELDPGNLTALFSLSRMALDEGDVVIAAGRLQELLEAHPAYVPALVSLGALFQDMGSLESLRPYVRTAIEFSPGNLAPRIVLARLELTLGEPDAALNAIDDAMAQFSGEAQLDHLRGLALLAKGENAAAMKSLLKAVAVEPGNPAFQFDLAQAQLINEYHESALDSARTFCELLPEDVRCPILLGDVALARRNGEEAVRHFEPVAERLWNRVVAMRLTRAYSMAGSEQADQPLATWLQEHPQDHEARVAYAQVLEGQGKNAASIAEYEALLAIDRLGAVGLNNLAWQYWQRGDDRALALAERAHELAPENGSVADTLGWILAGSDQLERAIPLLREAARQMSGNAEVRFHLASALARAGEQREASEIIGDLLESGESFPSRSEAERLAETL